MLFFQGDYAKAEPHLRTALDMQPKLTKIQALLGMAEKRTGDPADARTHLETSFAAVDEPKLKVQVGMELVELYTATQDLAKASSVVNAMRQADPANPAVLYAAYRVYSDLAGEAMLSLALAAPDSAQMHLVMAHEEVKQGNNAGARVQYQKAIEIDPQRAVAYANLADAYMKLGKTTEALKYYEKYAEMAPNSPSIEYVRKRIEELKGR